MDTGQGDGGCDLGQKLGCGGVAVEPELGAVTEIAMHRAALLAGDRDDQLVFDVDGLVFDFFDALGITEKIGFNVVFFAVVTDV
mgnify:FL=1